MQLTKEEIQRALKEVGANPIFPDSDIFIFLGEMIHTDKIESLDQFIQHMFNAGVVYKVSEIKRVLNIVDPKI